MFFSNLADIYTLCCLHHLHPDSVYTDFGAI